MLPANSALTRHALSSAGSAWAGIPRRHRSYCVLRLPAARRAALRCLRLALPRLRRSVRVPAVTPLLPVRVAGPAGQGFSISRRLPRPARCVETTGPPRFLGDPSARVRRSLTPAGPDAAGHTPRPMLPSVFVTTSAPTRLVFGAGSRRPRRSLSTLRSDGYPTATQDSLPAAGPALPGGIGYPQDPDARFSKPSRTSLPRLGLAHNDRDLLRRRGRVSAGSGQDGAAMGRWTGWVCVEGWRAGSVYMGIYQGPLDCKKSPRPVTPYYSTRCDG